MEGDVSQTVDILYTTWSNTNFPRCLSYSGPSEGSHPLLNGSSLKPVNKVFKGANKVKTNGV